jgi:hypothetical protein
VQIFRELAFAKYRQKEWPNENIDRIAAGIERNRGLTDDPILKNLLVGVGARPSKSATFAQAASRCGKPHSAVGRTGD